MKSLAALGAIAVALAVVDAPAAVAQEPVRPKPIVVVVHGRGHIDDADSAAMRKRWKRGLDSTIATTGAHFDDADVRLAWYADILDPAGLDACARTDDDSLGIGAFAAFVGALTSALPKNESREARSVMGDLLWLIDDARRCAAERRVGAVIEQAVATQRPVIVIGYSLGSLVTYGYLSRRNPRANDPEIHLVTVGSPLGNPIIRELLGQRADSLRRPLSVRSWQNVYDRNDVVAAPIAGFSVTDAAVDRVTENETSRDPHEIERYLGDRAMVAAMRRLLCGMSGTNRDCSR